MVSPSSDGMPVVEDETGAKPAWTEPDFRVYVFSLPRCGSSMMTGILEALGVHMVYTSEDPEQRDKMREHYKERFGEYVPNERFFEITRDAFNNWVKVNQTPYGGCKVIIPVQGMRWQAVCSQPAKVIMMWRDPAEIRQSQEAFYKKARANYTGDDEKEPWEIAEAYLRTALAQTEVMLQARRQQALDVRFSGNEDKVAPLDFMVVRYRDVLDDPQRMVRKVAQFIRADMMRVQAAVDTIDPSKIRFKKEELEEGI